MNTVSVTLRFSAGHRILGLAGPGAKCANVHGHNYTAIFTFYQQPGWPLHVEFGLVKQYLGEWIKANLDHGFILHEEDVFLTYLAENSLKFYALTSPPTTEAVANELAMAAQEMFSGYVLACVQVEEGPDNTAYWWPAATSTRKAQA